MQLFMSEMNIQVATTGQLQQQWQQQAPGGQLLQAKAQGGKAQGGKPGGKDGKGKATPPPPP